MQALLGERRAVNPSKTQFARVNVWITEPGCVGRIARLLD
jgi:hypothetical protein